MNNSNQHSNQILDALTREGVLINVSIRFWRATKKLRPEDLGLDPATVSDRLIHLGHKKLLPPERLQAFSVIESRAHAVVEAGTFPFLNGLGRFLPNAKLGEVMARLQELEREFAEAQRSFLEHYGELREQAFEAWREAANRLVTDPDPLLATIQASFPDPVAMARSFGFSVQLFQVRAPESVTMVAVDAVEQEQMLRAREQAARAAASQIQQGVQSFVAECVTGLRQQTAQLCEEMLESMRSGKTGVHQKTLNRLTRFIDEFRKLNFAGDHRMEQELERMRQEYLLRTAEEYRDDDSAKARLQAGIQGLAGYARELAGQENRELVERFGQLGQRRFHLAA